MLFWYQIFKFMLFDMRNERDSVVIGTVRNVHNLLFYGVVGKSVCRMWESCTLAFPCSVNGLFHDGIDGLFHDGIASYTHFHGACLLVFGFFVRNSVVLTVYLLFSVACFFTVHEHMTRVPIMYRIRKVQPASRQCARHLKIFCIR